MHHTVHWLVGWIVLLGKTAPASAVLITKVAYNAVDGLINMVTTRYTSEGVLK